MTHPQIDERMATLTALTALQHQPVVLPGGGATFQVIRPASIDPLLDDAMNDPEQNLPYWAEIWPSGVALAALLLSEPKLVQGLAVIELGCGVGITAVAAMRAGASLVATDYSTSSLLLTELNCLLNGEAMPETRQINWRDENAEMFQEDGSRWPVVLAADVLYEERDVEPVLAVMDRILAPGGKVLLAEPGRRPSKLAVSRAKDRGWRVETTVYTGPWPDQQDAETIVSVHCMTR